MSWSHYIEKPLPYKTFSFIVKITLGIQKRKLRSVKNLYYLKLILWKRVVCITIELHYNHKQRSFLSKRCINKGSYVSVHVLLCQRPWLNSLVCSSLFSFLEFTMGVFLHKEQIYMYFFISFDQFQIPSRSKTSQT